ncbi:MAG: site-2 protease family protein [Euryarchaeota archaeon]|nr:site-2 protease family protein [Euryarchaeota archaeon]
MSATEFEEINALVRRYIDVYEFRITPDHLEFYFTKGDDEQFSKNFEALRLALKKKNLVPMIKKSGGEYVLLVLKTPQRKFFGLWVNIALLIATVLSTIWVGMGYYEGYYGETDLWHGLLGGLLYFSVPLLAILGTHEMAHYFAARKHNIAASLPFFIPAPTMLGTLGAFISIREPIPDRRALIDVGLSGPIAGFLVAIPVTIIGLMLGASNPPHVNPEAMNAYYIFNVPLIYTALEYVFPSSNFVNPVAMAGWVGFVVTAINLFPIGQLDGGHVARALFGDKAKYVSYGFAALLIGLGILYPGWLFFGIIVVMLGLRHPPPLNEIVKLDKKRLAIAVTGFLILGVTFVPVPVEYHQVHEDMQITISADTSMLIMNTSYNTTTVSVKVVNNGDMRENVTINLTGNLHLSRTHYVFSLDSKSSRILNIRATALTYGKVNLTATLRTLTHISKEAMLNFTVFRVSESMHFSPDQFGKSEFNTTLINEGSNRTVHFISLNNVSFNITNVPSDTLNIGANQSKLLHILVVGSTVLIAADYATYEVALLRVTLGT